MRTLLYVATASGRSTVGEISPTFFQISAHHLGKVVHHPREARFRHERPEAPGGVALRARPAREITIGEVVRGFRTDVAPPGVRGNGRRLRDPTRLQASAGPWPRRNA